MVWCTVCVSILEFFLDIINAESFGDTVWVCMDLVISWGSCRD